MPAGATPAHRPHSFSTVLRSLAVVMHGANRGGMVVNLSSAWRHVRLVRELDQGEPAGSGSLTQAVQPYCWRWSDSLWRSTCLRTRFCEHSFPRHRGEYYATGNKQDST